MCLCVSLSVFVCLCVWVGRWLWVSVFRHTHVCMSVCLCMCACTYIIYNKIVDRREQSLRRRKELERCKPGGWRRWNFVMKGVVMVTVTTPLPPSCVNRKKWIGLCETLGEVTGSTNDSCSLSNIEQGLELCKITTPTKKTFRK